MMELILWRHAEAEIGEPDLGRKLTGRGDKQARRVAEWLHAQLRGLWGFPDPPAMTMKDRFAARYRGKRYSFGYPACPDHTEKATLWRMLDAEKSTGIRLTESYAMYPTAAVSGWYFSHPEAKYFQVGRIDADQVADYARRKGVPVAEAERWLAPIMGYEQGSRAA